MRLKLAEINTENVNKVRQVDTKLTQLILTRAKQ
ncbi:hypothetical protein M2103_002512 [Ereboglobus sp. PH5-5]|nr:hypothetical protein [Ereboglobus sp. PH5-5]